MLCLFLNDVDRRDEEKKTVYNNNRYRIVSGRYDWGSGLAGEVSARLTMAMKLVRTLDYYEYHWRGEGKERGES